MQAPDFKRCVEVEERSDFVRGAAGDDNHARFFLVLDAIQKIADAGPGDSLKAVDVEGRQRAVVVEQEQRAAGARKPREEFFQLL